MKTFLVFLCGLGFAGAVWGQEVVAPPVAVDPNAAVAVAEATPAPAATQTTQPTQGTVVATPPFSADELNQLLGPIALYPDPLIGLVLPASTAPSDIVLADRYLQQNGDPAQIPNQPWDESVKGLTHYPSLLKWLDENLTWTSQLGEAYVAQPADVMNAIQQLRAKAKADGALANSDQQSVAVDDGMISIVPANDNSISVPVYDSNSVYDGDFSEDDGPVITYGVGYPVGPWLSYWPNWYRHGIYCGDWRRWRSFRGGDGFCGGCYGASVGG